MKIGAWDIGGKVVKKDERYTVKDNTYLTKLVLSSTDLNPGHSTTGHSHIGQEEVYMFIEGRGEMQLDDDRFEVYPGDTVLIPGGVFHRVFNTSTGQLRFNCVFDGARGE